MLSFKNANKDKIRQILSKFSEEDSGIISSLIGKKGTPLYAEVDGSVIFRIVADNVNCAFTFPLGDGWQSVIAFLITYTREYYLPIRFVGVKANDIPRLLTMFPNYSPEITPSDSVPDTYDISL